VQSKFTTALSFGEFIGMGLPFIIHAAFQSRSKSQKALTVIAMIVGFYIVLKTDSRLAIGSFFAAVVLYGAYWAYQNRRENRQSVLAPMLLLAYPAGMGALLVLSVAWHRLEVMIWGGAATQSSTDARKVMLDMGLPMIYRNPVGHGFGMGAETLGFFSPGGKLTIDIYYLNAALEYGVIGTGMFFLIFAIAAFQAAYVGVNARKGELTYGVPIAIALVNFLISKTVLAQQENHPLAFLLVGMAAAVVYREKQISGQGSNLNEVHASVRRRFAVNNHQ
jgi:hypothetical protein